jgi:hypothetical protein
MRGFSAVPLSKLPLFEFLALSYNKILAGCTVGMRGPRYRATEPDSLCWRTTYCLCPDTPRLLTWRIAVCTRYTEVPPITLTFECWSQSAFPSCRLHTFQRCLTCLLEIDRSAFVVATGPKPLVRVHARSLSPSNVPWTSWIFVVLKESRWV